MRRGCLEPRIFPLFSRALTVLKAVLVSLLFLLNILQKNEDLLFRSLRTYRLRGALKVWKSFAWPVFFETMFKFTLPATHIIKLFGKKERIVTV